jgi:hypothetical protein
MNRVTQYRAAISGALNRPGNVFAEGAPFSDADWLVAVGALALNRSTWTGEDAELERIRALVTDHKNLDSLVQDRLDALNPKVQTARDAAVPSVVAQMVELMHVHSAVAPSLQLAIESLLMNYDGWSQTQADALAPVSELAMEWKVTLDHAEVHPTNAFLNALIHAQSELELDRLIEASGKNAGQVGELIDLAAWAQHIAKSPRHEKWGSELAQRAGVERLAASAQADHKWRAERKVAGSDLWSLYVRFFDEKIEVVYLGPESSRPTGVGVGDLSFEHTKTSPEGDGVVEMVWSASAGVGRFWAEFPAFAIGGAQSEEALVEIRTHGVA